MHTMIKIIVSLSIIWGPITTAHINFAATSTEHIQFADQSNNEPVANYDDFDTLADDMVNMGVRAEEPQPLSTIDSWTQKIGSPIIMKYVLIKEYLRNWCYFMIGVKKYPITNKDKKRCKSVMNLRCITHH